MLAIQLCDYSATIENQRAMTDLSDFLEVARQDNDATSRRQSLVHQQINIRFRSDVDALGRLLQHEYGATGGEAASQHSLLLVAAAQRGNYPFGIGRPNIKPLEQVNGAASLRPRIKEAEETPSHNRRVQEEVFPHRQARSEALFLPIAGDEGDPRFNCLSWQGEPRAPAANADLASEARQYAG